VYAAMKVSRTFFAVASLFLAVSVFRSAAQPVTSVASAPTYVPDYSHANDMLPENVLAFDSWQKTVEATNGQDFARFLFLFTNVATKVEAVSVTNFNTLTNFTTVTNHSFWAWITGDKFSSVPNVVHQTNVLTATNSAVPAAVSILNVHPGCGCTTAELPPTPWYLPPGTNSEIRISVNLSGKAGMLFKTVTITTDHGRRDLMLRINIAPPPPPRQMTEAERAQGVATAKIDRQAVFKGDCASCHAKGVEGKYGQQLFAQVCGICHEANPRATMVPDLHNLKDPTSEEFWRTWITAGKAGTLMPAFATSQGGPLSDMQIASLAAYLNAIIPPHVPPAASK